MEKAKYIFLNAIPILIMVALIPLVQNDYVLSLIYVLIIFVSFSVKRGPKDISIFLAGFLLLAFSEAIFVSTGVETFTRRTLLDLMPAWLPFL